MEFTPDNPVVKHCLRAFKLVEVHRHEAAEKLFSEAWEIATENQEKLIAAYCLGRHQPAPGRRRFWWETALTLAEQIADPGVQPAIPMLHRELAATYQTLNQPETAKQHSTLAQTTATPPTDEGPFYHGTKADLQPGAWLTPGNESNYAPGLIMNHIYFTALLHGAALAAALAKGSGRERIYIVQPAGDIENDPNVTNKKFPGNPTRSYRSRQPMKVTGEITDWQQQSPETIRKWQERLAKTKGKIINE